MYSRTKCYKNTTRYKLLKRIPMIQTWMLKTETFFFHYSKNVPSLSRGPRTCITTGDDTLKMSKRNKHYVKSSQSFVFKFQKQSKVPSSFCCLSIWNLWNLFLVTCTWSLQFTTPNRKNLSIIFDIQFVIDTYCCDNFCLLSRWSDALSLCRIFCLRVLKMLRSVADGMVTSRTSPLWIVVWLSSAL